MREHPATRIVKISWCSHTKKLLIKTFKTMKIFCILKNPYFGLSKNLILKMKLTFLLIFISLMQVSATIYSQNTKFTFKADNKQIVEVLKEIEDNSNFRFFYLREQVDVERKVSITANDATVEQILDELFKGRGIDYELMNDFFNRYILAVGQRIE